MLVVGGLFMVVVVLVLLLLLLLGLGLFLFRLPAAPKKEGGSVMYTKPRDMGF